MFLRRSIALLLATAACDTTPTATPARLECATPPTVVATSARGLGAGTSTGPAIIYLNRCIGGCDLTPGADDAIRGVSSIIPGPTHFEELSASDAQWDAFVDCVTRVFLPFEVQVTDVDPGNVPRFENIVAGRPQTIGMAPTIGGVAPGICAVHNNAISFTFGELAPDEPESLCVVAAHEIGHTLGLEHHMLCNDPMTYLPECGQERLFRRVDAHCGENSRTPCSCGGGEFQNTHIALLDALGPRVGRLNLRPRLRILTPVAITPVEPGFAVHVEALDDRAIELVRAKVGGADVGTSTLAPYLFYAPRDLAVGRVTIEVEAVDDEGASQTLSLEVDVKAATPRPDASINDAENGDRPMIIGLEDAGAPPDADTVQAIDAGGCVCVTAPRDGSAIAAVMLLLALALGRRRAVALLVVLAAACSDGGDGLVSSSGTLALDPPPGTALAFAPVILGRGQPPRVEIVATNTGDAPIELGEAHFTGPRAALFTVLAQPRALMPGESKSVWLTFEPSFHVLGAEATLHLPNTSANLPAPSYPIAGSARAPCQLFATPVMQAFGDEDEREVRIEAAGLSPCTITRLSLSADLFSIVDPPSFPVTLQPGEALTLLLRSHTRTDTKGRPTRTLIAFEADGGDVRVQLLGRSPIWDCVQVTPDPDAEREESREPIVELDFPPAGPTALRQRIVLINRCTHETPKLVSTAVGAGFEHFRVETPSLPVSLPTDRPIGLWVHRRPSLSGLDDYGEIHLDTDDAAAPRITLRARGRGVKSPRLHALPRVDFGAIPDVALCASRVRAVRLYNFGEGAATVESLAVSTPEFAILSVERDGRTLDPRQPLEVAGGAWADVRIEALAGASSGTLGVRSDAPELRVALVASRVPPGPAEDRFTLDRPRKSDVVFVLDDSLSAADLRSRLRAALPSWLTASAGLDQRFAVVAADPTAGAAYRCVGFEPYLETGVLGPDELLRGLRCLLTPFQSPPRGVGGIGAAVRFFEENASAFHRDGARLAVIMVSDDDDSSPQPTTLAARFFEDLAGADRPDRAAAHDISVIDPSACSPPFDQAGARYHAVTRATGGLGSEACASDLGPALQAIAAHTHRTDATFSLSRAADPAGLSVTLGGARVPEDALDGYTFDRSANTVTLHGASALALGTEVVVRYAPDCAPPR